MLCSKNKKVAASIPQFLVKSNFFNKIFFIWNTKLSDLTPYSRILYFLRKQSIISKIITQFDQNEKKIISSSGKNVATQPISESTAHLKTFRTFYFMSMQSGLCSIGSAPTL